METKSLTPEQIEALKPIDEQMTELCLLAADYQERFGTLPALGRNTQVEDKVVCIIACLVAAKPAPSAGFRENIL